MTKRDVFWESIRSDSGDTVAWPSESAERSLLASKIVGAAIVGAAEHVLGESLDRLEGLPPPPGSEDYQASLRDAEVLSTLSEEQRNALARLMREIAYHSLYWPMAKMRNLPGITVKLLAARDCDDASSPETYNLTEFLEPHQLLIEWIGEFGEFIDPALPLARQRAMR